MTFYCLELSTVEYTAALDLQKRIVEQKKRDPSLDDVLLLLEHRPVYTLGRRGGRENLVVSESFLREKSIPIVHVERGGNITYHGPGQLVGYPIVSLKERHLRVVDFVDRLEEVMLRTARDFHVRALRDERNRGVWVGNNKLGSIGIAVTRGISFHGFSFNVNTDLQPFSWINPCGLNGVGVTSLEQEQSASISMPRAIEHLKSHFIDIFEVELVTAFPDWLSVGSATASPE